MFIPNSVSPSGKTENLEMLPILFAEVVNFLIRKVKDIVIFAANFELNTSAKSVLCM